MIAKRLVAVGIIAALVLAGLAQATVTVVYDPGTLYSTTALTGFSTHGDDMKGMLVTATGAASQTATWIATGADAGGAFGTNWSLVESGDTWDQIWTLSNQTSGSISSILINAAPGNTVFDITFDGLGGTAGSELGKTFTLQNAPAGLDIRATYRNKVALTGNAAVGDLWAQLQLDFTSTGGLCAGKSLTFLADTDSAKSAGDIRPVPAPGAILLVGIGTSLVGWLRRRRTV